MTKRVAVTGMGIICSAGDNLKGAWDNITAGQPGISRIEQIETDHLPVQIAGEVKNFQLPEDILPLKEQGRYDRFIHFALYAADRALIQANLKGNLRGYSPERIGTIMGIGMGGFPIIERSHKIFLEKGARRVSPFLIPSLIPSMATGVISILNGFKGINYTVSSACASAAHAIGAAVDEIRAGRHDVILTGGAESVISDLTISGFSNMKALSRRNDKPQKASRPFDIDRNGFVIGEGSGAIVLENLEKAKARGATIYAEIAGHASSSDAYHITAPHPEGLGARQCMQAALSSASLKPEEIGYINAHGTSTPLGDKGETEAIKETFGKHAYELPISSTKSMIGHLLGAAGGVETIFCIQALHTGVLPPTINLDNQDPECDLNYIPNQAIEKNIDYALNNSFGFGGTNCSLILKKYKD